jgi:hypothetical protein
LFIGEGFSGILWAFIDLIYAMLADENILLDIAHAAIVWRFD